MVMISERIKQQSPRAAAFFVPSDMLAHFLADYYCHMLNDSIEYITGSSNAATRKTTMGEWYMKTFAYSVYCPFHDLELNTYGEIKAADKTDAASKVFELYSRGLDTNDLDVQLKEIQPFSSWEMERAFNAL